MTSRKSACGVKFIISYLRIRNYHIVSSGTILIINQFQNNKNVDLFFIFVRLNYFLHILLYIKVEFWLQLTILRMKITFL